MKTISLLLACTTALIFSGCSKPAEVPEKESTPPAAEVKTEGQEQTHPPNHGIMVPMLSGMLPVAYAEVKLHADKGDIEVWFTRDEAGTQPLDLPLDTKMFLTLSKLEPAWADLRVRNTTQNEDETGTPNIRNNQTNYFIYPGDTGADTSHLMGKDFSTPALIEFTVHGASVSSEEFELRPHVH